MSELKKLEEYLTKSVEAINTGITKFVHTLPVLVKQQFTTIANRRLHSTKDQYLSALKIRYDQLVLVVELDADDWLANAVENGIDGWEMKKTHLRSPKAKISKKGYRYMHIPIPKTKDPKGFNPDNQKNAELQQKIIETLKNPAFDAQKVKNLGGKVIMSQRLITEDPDLKGFYRFKSFGSFEDYHKKKKTGQWGYVMLRTMSENPESKSFWEHPGIKPAKIFREVEQWMAAELDTILNNIVVNELDKIQKDFGM